MEFVACETLSPMYEAALEVCCTLMFSEVDILTNDFKLVCPRELNYINSKSNFI